MVRVLNKGNQLSIKITNTKYLGKKDWIFLKTTCKVFFNKLTLPIVIEIDNHVVISPLIKRAFNRFYKNNNNTIIVIK